MHVATLLGQFLGSSLVFLPAAIIIFPISYIIGDVLTEVYGFRMARGVIWLGASPCLVFWTNQDVYSAVLGQFPLILWGLSWLIR